MSNVKVLVHIVISTYQREMAIGTDYAERLYNYLTGIIINNKCHRLAINGIPNHIHILIDLNPQIALSDLIKEIKRSSSLWMKRSGYFPVFKKWGDGYFAVSISDSHKQDVINYIKGQREHHSLMRFDNEYDRLILKNGMTLYKYPDEEPEI